MGVKQISSGEFINEKEIFNIELSNNKGNYVKIFNYGTIVNQFVVTNKNGVKQDIVLGFDNFLAYLNPVYLANYPYFGATIGRYANRIKNAEFNLNNTNYKLNKNDGNNCLHGGTVGFDKKVWDIIATSQAPYNSVTFQYFSLDGEEGFPGDLAIQLTFAFTDFDELILTYQADCDEATPINLTHHSYFNLAANGENITKHLQQIYASHYLAQDNNFVVTGELLPVAGTLHDFRAGKLINENWDEEQGYDQTYVLDKTYGTLSLATKTSHPNSGLTLAVYTTEPVAHLYTGKHLAVKDGKNGKNYTAFDGFCIETQHHPNAINILNFPNTVLQAGAVYNQTTIYKIIVA